MPSAQKMSQPQATNQLSGSAKLAAMFGLHASRIESHEEVGAQHVADAYRPVQGSDIPLWLTAITICWLSGTMPAMLPWAFP